ARGGLHLQPPEVPSAEQPHTVGQRGEQLPRVSRPATGTGAAEVFGGAGRLRLAKPARHDANDWAPARPLPRLARHAGALHLSPGVPAAQSQPGEEEGRVGRHASLVAAPGPARSALNSRLLIRVCGAPIPARRASEGRFHTSPKRQREIGPPSLALRAGMEADYRLVG